MSEVEAGRFQARETHTLCYLLSPVPQRFREAESYSAFTSQTAKGDISKMPDAEGGASIYCPPYTF